MLNFLNHFSVPGVEHVMVYHDDQRDDLYYIVPELPSILRRENGTPSFNLISFARDFSLLANEASELPTAETEGGLLAAHHVARSDRRGPEEDPRLHRRRDERCPPPACSAGGR